VVSPGQGQEVLDVKDPDRVGMRVTVDAIGIESVRGAGCWRRRDAIEAGSEKVKAGVHTETAAVVELLKVVGAYCVGIGLEWLGQG
jgi:hypothetical protein